MKRLLAPALTVSMAVSGASAFAGGPVVIEEEGQPEVVAEAPRSGWIVPVVVGLVLLCALACGSDDNGGAATTPGTVDPSPPDT